MTNKQFNTFCEAFKAATYVVQWGGSHVWKVGGKVFALGVWEKANSPAITFKTSPLNFDFLLHKDHYRPAPYLASRGFKWIQQYEASSELDEELRYYVTQSYKLVSAGLTKKKQVELGVNLR
ncbi:MAG: putative DNA-binding protein (MmcQ/YjbR family) [Kangiellaceae bacterium]|jgi:predicted DNA-binding protein (MmcQ/YjbR family)